MGLVDKPKYDLMTHLETEMFICSEYLHCTHTEFEKLPRTEKLKWFLFLEMKSRREKHEELKRQDLQVAHQSKPYRE